MKTSLLGIVLFAMTMTVKPAHAEFKSVAGEAKLYSNRVRGYLQSPQLQGVSLLTFNATAEIATLVVDLNECTPECTTVGRQKFIVGFKSRGEITTHVCSSDSTDLCTYEVFDVEAWKGDGSRSMIIGYISAKVHPSEGQWQGPTDYSVVITASGFGTRNESVPLQATR